MRPAGETRRPTWVSQVEEALALFDQPLSGRQLVDLITGSSVNQISAALHYLQRMHVIDAMLVQDEPFWFLTGNDERTKKLEFAQSVGPRVRKGGYVTKRRKPGALIKPLSRKKEAK